MRITIPDLSLVLLIGPAGSGKTTFARTHFKPTEVLSIEQARQLVADDALDSGATEDAFAALSYLAMRRLAAGRLTVIDDRHLNPHTRRMLLGLAQEQHVIPVAIAFNLPEPLLHQRNQSRGGDMLPAETISQQHAAMRHLLATMPQEGFRHIYEFLSEEESSTVEVVRQALWNRRPGDHGPFDIVGDIHGCYDELRALLGKLGYLVFRDGDSPLARHQIEHPLGRRLIFLGDLAGFGPKIPDALRLVMDAVDTGVALTVPGDHDMHLVNWLEGRESRLRPGLEASTRQLGGLPEEFTQEVRGFLSSTVSHYQLAGGDLVVAHAGLPEALQGRGSMQVRQFAVFGESPESEIPVAPEWPSNYMGPATVVYGHAPVERPEWRNRTIDIDTGCVFGGKLTALRYPERELVSVDAGRAYAESPAEVSKSLS